MKYHRKLCALQHSSQMQMDQGISRPLAAEEMVAGWKSWAKVQPGPEAITMATVVMAILLQPAVTPLRSTSKDVSLSYSGLGFGRGKFNFYALSWGGGGGINSFFHINLANPNLQSKDQCPAAQPGRGPVCLWYRKPVACLSFAFYLFLLLSRNSAAQHFQQAKPRGGQLLLKPPILSASFISNRGTSQRHEGPCANNNARCILLPSAVIGWLLILHRSALFQKLMDGSSE